MSHQFLCRSGVKKKKLITKNCNSIAIVTNEKTGGSDSLRVFYCVYNGHICTRVYHINASRKLGKIIGVGAVKRTPPEGTSFGETSSTSGRGTADQVDLW